jgi:hypothetical protein
VSNKKTFRNDVECVRKVAGRGESGNRNPRNASTHKTQGSDADVFINFFMPYTNAQFNSEF